MSRQYRVSVYGCKCRSILLTLLIMDEVRGKIIRIEKQVVLSGNILVVWQICLSRIGVVFAKVVSSLNLSNTLYACYFVQLRIAKVKTTFCQNRTYTAQTYLPHDKNIPRQNNLFFYPDNFPTDLVHNK